MNELISVIVPVYKVEDYLPRCIDSILNQTWRNFELILVDDGSPDGCGAICDSYARTTPPIVKIIHKQNGGLSDARNAGIEAASGDYLTFIDSDDHVAPDHLEYMMGLIRREPGIQIAITAIANICPGQQIPPVPDNVWEAVLSREETLRRMLVRRGVSHSSCAKLFAAELWKDQRFPVGQNYEDLATTYHLVTRAGKVACSSAARYYYLQREDSIMHEACNEKTLSILNVVDQVADYLRQQCPELEAEILDRQMVTYMKSYQAILNTGMDAFPEHQKKIRAFVKKHGIPLLLDRAAPLADKVKVMLIPFGKRAFLHIYNLFADLR